VYQVGINKGIILRCTAYQISTFPVEPTRHHNAARQCDHPSTTTASIIYFAIILRIAKHFNSPRTAAHLGPSNVLHNIVKHF